MKRIKLAIVSGVWKRPEVFEMFAQGIHELEKMKQLEIVTIISGSEGEKSKKMVENHGFDYVEIPNQPLAVKMNAPVYRAKDLKVDFVLCLGSDDIISPELMEIYIDGMRKKADFIGVTDFYFYDTTTKKSIYWGGYKEPYRSGCTCGAGRILSKRLLNVWNWNLWETKHSHILDNSIDEKLRTTDHSSYTFAMADYNVFALDVKSSVNMTPFKLWPNSQFINNSVLENKFPYVFNK